MEARNVELTGPTKPVCHLVSPAIPTPAGPSSQNLFEAIATIYLQLFAFSALEWPIGPLKITLQPNRDPNRIWEMDYDNDP